MTETDAILVRALAHSDALRLAVRNQGRFAGSNRCLGLNRLATKGVPYRVNSAGDEAGRKAGERELVELAGLGLLALVRDRTKWPWVKLSDVGEAQARAVCGLPALDVGRLILGAIAGQTDREPRTLDRYWLPETALNGGRGWGLDATVEDRRGLARVELDYLPAAARGWLVANSDIRGHGYYGVTSAGLAELGRPAQPPAAWDDLPEFSVKARRLYRDELVRKLGTMANDSPDNEKEIGRLPLPESMVGIAFPGSPWDWRNGLASDSVGRDDDDQDLDPAEDD